ncbi:MAG TPA: alcohol dehydrogenase catalytic domain-containing protein, partial [Polyangiaceae bacterium]|nr:alcohol dehydrogenase catalytic domain-containing protein [Polyangiaceae bacterium]
MKAAVLRRRGGPEVLALADVPAPRVAGPRDVLVRVRAAGVNPVDAYLRAGLVPVPLRYPWVLGGDAAGTVEAVGPAVTRFAPGQRVFGMLDYVRRPGCYAELALFRDDELAPAP